MYLNSRCNPLQTSDMLLSALFSLHVLLISMALCVIFLALYRHLEEFGHTEHLGYFRYFKEEEERQVHMSLENRQSGGGQSTGIDILSVRGSVQGRF